MEEQQNIKDIKDTKNVEDIKEQDKSQKKEKKKKDRKKAIIIAIILILLLAIGFGTGTFQKIYDLILHRIQNPITTEEPNNDKRKDLDFEDDQPISDINKSQSENQDSITIPGYGDLVLTEKSPNVAFSNPAENTVYLIYTFTNADTGEQIAQTKAIKPGNQAVLNLRDLLNTRETKVTVAISTYDINTQVECNGAVQTINITKTN